ncbi:choice-of-anchor L domain-containing protein [Flavobacterium hibernum]|uniref:Ig-like domain-containing protein n=1 Tax=Flavobacterium hibernum TaxID=37752 RepID=A0A0D0EEB2_9FLAO|nr:choice-of-anchor L domain-containing protein [Flavobacterium hibernum]KIO52049.1 hypothetical protein IW18_13020 [Flavobacterium hibernum]
MRTKSTLKEVGEFIECCKYIFPFQKNIQQEAFSKISLKSLLILILGCVFFSSTISAQEIPFRAGNTLTTTRVTSKSTAKSAGISALAAVAGSIDVANPAAGYNNYTPDDLVRNILTSGCLTINNVRFGYYRRNNANSWTWVNHDWSEIAGDRQLGYYSKGSSTFPIDEGLLLSTGKISSAMGPNTYTNRSDEMVDEASDPDLAAISGRTMYDASILEFNFVPDGNLVEFKFVFASEEYLEYVNSSFNDAFGFFLSGPGINSTYTNNAINLAKLTNGDAVTVNNIHSAGSTVNGVPFAAKNDAYYINNPLGSTTMEYDGSTVVLTATYTVTPGQNYKIKMAIADASDQKWDSGVFLKAKSFATNTLVITNPASVCLNGTANITLPAITAGSTAGLTYTYWKDAAATIPYTTPTVSPVGTYYIKGKNDQSGCYDIKPVVVSQTNIVITETTASHVDVKCKGTATGSAAVTVSGGTTPYTYSWNTSPVQTGATATNLGAGTYTVTVTDGKGCSNTKQITITEPAAGITVTKASQTDVLCFGNSTGAINITPSGGTSTYTYDWADLAGTNDPQNRTGLASGTYTVVVKDSNGCSSAPLAVTITQPGAALSCSVVQNKPVTANGLSNGEATVTVIGGTTNYTYLWDNAETTQKATALNAGLHSVKVTDANGCTTECTVQITEPNVLSCSISQDAAVKCYGGNNGKATVIAVGGNGDYTYKWDNGETTSTAIALIAGSHTVIVTDKLNYTTTCNVTISQPQEALSATTTQVNVTCGGGTTGSATVIPSGGTNPYTYSWNTTPVQTGVTATGLKAGTYEVTVKDDNLCSITKSVTIIDGDSVVPVINPLPQASTINCPAEPVFAQATATDNSGTTPTLSYVDAITPGGCAGAYTKTRTWTAVDACGNTSLPVSQVIIVQDNTKPTWSTVVDSLNKTIECSDAAALTSAQALFPSATKK